MSYAKAAKRGIRALNHRQYRSQGSTAYHLPRMTMHEKALRMNAQFDRERDLRRERMERCPVCGITPMCVDCNNGNCDGGKL